MIIEKNKLYCDLKYPSLFKYLVKELKYSEASFVRVNATRLMLKSPYAVKKINDGSLNLTNAFEANKVCNKCKVDKKIIENVIDQASKIQPPI